ncbi:MAG: S8 family serine peptidase, partial [Acidobacteriota bacterium]
MLALAHPSLAARALAARRLAATLAFALLLLGAPASANQKPLAPSKSEPKFQPAAVDGIAGEYIVVLEGIPTATRRDGAAVTSRVRNTAEMLTARYGGEIQRSFAHAMTGVVVRMGEAQARLLAQDPDVAYVSQNRLLTIAQEAAGSCFRPSARGAQGTGRALVEAPAAAASSSQVVDCPVLDPRDPSYDCDGNWGLDRIDQVCPPLDGFYDQPATGAGVHAYVVDSGIRSNHVEFAGRLGNGVNAAVPVGHPNRFDVEDCNPIGHGTHVAGILGGTFSGVAKGVTLHPVKRVDECGPGDPIGGDEGSLIDAFDWVIANHQAPALVSLSSNARVGWSAAAQAAADRLIAAGIPLVQSAGNRGRDACQFTLRGSGTITVGGSDLNDEQANDGRWVREEDDPSFDAFCGVDCESNFGSCVDLWAPAGHIVSADRGSSSGTCRLSGTSMAAPHVAGAVALYLQGFVGGKLPSPSAVRAAIVGGATRGVLDDDPASPHRIFPGSPNRLLDVHRRGGGPGTCAPNHAPVASWIHSGTGLDRTLDGSRSTDDRGIVEYRWSLPGDVVKYGQVVEHLFPGYGSHFVSLTVTDADGVSHTSIPRSILLSPPTVTPREGLWHNPARSGSGFDFYANTAGNYTLLWY